MYLNFTLPCSPRVLLSKPFVHPWVHVFTPQPWLYRPKQHWWKAAGICEHQQAWRLSLTAGLNQDRNHLSLHLLPWNLTTHHSHATWDCPATVIQGLKDEHNLIVSSSAPLFWKFGTSSYTYNGTYPVGICAWAPLKIKGHPQLSAQIAITPMYQLLLVLTHLWKEVTSDAMNVE